MWLASKKGTSMNINQPFDPLLLNGLGSKRDRKWNHILYSVMSFNAALSIPIGLYILNGIIKKWYYHDWFLISYVICIFDVLIFLAIWCYLHIAIFKHTRTHKHINKHNPILVCEYQGSFKNYCVWILGFLYIFIVYSMAIVLSVFAPPFIVIVLFHIFISKPFLLKRILLFENDVILEYRIFGNLKLSREGLALMAIPRPSKNLAFVRPQLFAQDKYPHIMANFCTRFNPFGMNNVNALIQELDSQMGYSAYEMTKNKKVFTTDIDWNCLKIYL